MDRPETPHWDVAAYALGVLDQREIPGYERHLARCPSCATELERLVPATAVLADVDPAELREVDDFRLANRLLAAVRGQRRRARTRQRVAVAAGTTVTAAVAGFALFTGGSWLAGPAGVAGPPATTPVLAATPIGIGGPELGGAERFSATDPTTGVHADVLLEDLAWGTRVSFALSALPGPRECQLVVVRTDGTPEEAATWRVPAEGYGTTAQPSLLILQAATAVPRTGIAHIQVRELDPDGTTTTLVTVPV
jgi:hypothetical protein